ncbi:MAG TPA: GNAT family N-acetyltransferase [Amycolatopsis sp.]|nr:GNAT family N-acetyltransferase [Amycolatopsis sp.]
MDVSTDTPIIETTSFPLSVAGDEITAAQLHGILRLRVDVFVVEQDCAYHEIDGRDLLPGTRHLWIGGSVAVDSYLRVLQDAGGTFRIGRVCTAVRSRGKGLAGRLMETALAGIGDAPCVLDAQTYAKDFYAKYGFVVEGDEFLEDGIPHLTMWRREAPRS